MTVARWGPSDWRATEPSLNKDAAVLILIVSSGPDKGRVYELFEDKPVVIGREGDPIKLNDRKASREHARLWSEGGRWYVQDQGSRHGTLRNGKPIEQAKTPLKDGDHLRLGNTLLVLARLPVEQVERMHLLGDPDTGDDVPRRMAMPVARPARIGAIAVAAAITAVAGLNVYSLMQSQTQTDELRREIASSKTSDNADTQPLLREMLAKLDAQQQRDAMLEEIRASLAEQPAALSKLDTILAKVDAQATNTELLAEISSGLAEQRELAQQQRDDLGEVLVKLDEPKQPVELDAFTLAKLDGVLEKLNEPAPTTTDTQAHEKLDAVLARLNEKSDAPTAVSLDEATLAKLDAVLAAANAEPQGNVMDDAIRAQLDSIQDELARRPRATLAPEAAAQLQAVLAKLDAQPDPDVWAEQLTGRIAADVAQQLQQTEDPSASLLKQIVANLEDQRNLSSQIAELRDTLAQQPTETKNAVRQALAELHVDSDTDTLLAAIDQVKAALPEDAIQKLDDVLARLDAQASPQQLIAAFEAIVENRSGEQLASLEQLHSDLKQLAEAQRTTPDAIVGEIRTAMAAREEADARLAELVELAAAPPPSTEQTNALLQQVLAELRNRSDGPSDEVLRQVLSELRSKAIASMDELRATIRSELDARHRGGAPAPITVAQAPGRTDRSRVPMQTALLSPELGEDSTITDASMESLTRTEQAYRLAFETGQPVALGAGVVNPITGDTSEGRTLDPAAARAAGIKSWREWYLVDDFAERMRLQQQAMHYRESNERDADIVTLPAPKTER